MFTSAGGGRLRFLIVAQHAGDAFAPESLLLALRRASKRGRAGLAVLGQHTCCNKLVLILPLDTAFSIMLCFA
jgi:hypothetical protein